MTRFGNRITICLGLLALFDVGKSMTCTAIGDTWQDVVSGTSATDGEFDIHDGFPCDAWGVSADYSVSFDWKVEEWPTDGGYWNSMVQIGKQMQRTVHILFCNVHPTP